MTTASLPLPTAPAADASLNVLIAHDDEAAYRRALRLLASTVLCTHCEGTLVQPLPWRFNELGVDSWRWRAAADAPRAEIIIVSTSACAELPEAVSVWLDQCFAVRRQQPTAVIALCAELNDLVVPWRRKVRTAAEAAGLDFLEVGAAAG